MTGIDLQNIYAERDGGGVRTWTPAITRLVRRLDAAGVFRRLDGCWVWPGAQSVDGYGSIGSRPGKTVATHRVTYEFYIGRIPPGMQIDHLCRNRLCCNPWHLEVVTSAENARRARAVRVISDYCARGHHFDKANTYHYNGKRGCRECRRAASARYDARRKAGASA